MKIKQFTIGITSQELDTLGAALEKYIVEEMKIYKDSIDIMIEEEVKLLRDLADIGYSLYVRTEEKTGDWQDDVLNGKLTIDVDEWIEYQKRELGVVK